MDVRPTPEVEALFTLYEQFSRESNYKKLAKLFGNPMIAVGPHGVVLHRNNFITRWQYDRSMRSFYGKAGLSSMRIVSIWEHIVSDEYSLVKVYWSATFRKTSSQSLEFHISYLVRKKKNRVEIVLFIAHEDEKKILEGYGILK